jgi:hypothetical protein
MQKKFTKKLRKVLENKSKQQILLVKLIIKLTAAISILMTQIFKKLREKAFKTLEMIEKRRFIQV